MKTHFQWQLIEMLPVVEGRIHEILTEAEVQWESLEAMKHHSHALDVATTERLLATYETKREHVQFLKTQALRWRQTDPVTERQHTLLNSLDHVLHLTEKVIQHILGLAQHFLNGTLDSLIVEENRTWMNTILTGNAAVPVSFKEELTTLKAIAETLSSLQQETIVIVHERMRTLQAAGASEADYLQVLYDHFPTMKGLFTPEKHDALVYYCCLYPGFNEAMRLWELWEQKIVQEEETACFNKTLFI